MALFILDFITYTLAVCFVFFEITPANSRLMQWLVKHVHPVAAAFVLVVVAVALTYIRHAA